MAYDILTTARFAGSEKIAGRSLQQRIAVLATVCSALVVSPAAAETRLQPHTAQYTLTMDPTSQGYGVVEVKGAFVQDFSVTCDGATLDQSMVAVIQPPQAPALEIKGDVSFWESISGDRYRYVARMHAADQVILDVTGDARIQPGKSGQAKYQSGGKEFRVELPKGTLFPIAFTRRIANRLGPTGSTFSATVFDGVTDVAPLSANAIVGPASQAKSLPDALTLLKPLKRAKINYAFFSMKDQGSTPLQEGAYVGFENGVTSEMELGISGLKLIGTLVKLTYGERPACN